MRLVTEFVDDFASFYEEYKEHIVKHYEDFSETFKGGRKLDIDVELYQALIDSGTSNIFTVKDKDTFVGYVSVSITKSVLFKGKVDAVIDHFYIEESSRGNGYAKEILEELEQLLNEDRVDYVGLGLPCSEEMNNFADSRGYVKHSSIYYKGLGDS